MGVDGRAGSQGEAHQLVGRLIVAVQGARVSGPEAAAALLKTNVYCESQNSCYK